MEELAAEVPLGPPSKPPDPPPDPPDDGNSDSESVVLSSSKKRKICPSTLPKTDSLPHMPSSQSTPINFYSIHSRGPYIVYAQKTEQGKTIHPLEFGKFLSTINNLSIKPGGVKAEGRFRISVEFLTGSAANSFIKNIYISSNSKFKAYIPTYNVTRMGLVRGISTDLSIEEIISSLSTPQHIGKPLKARRLNYKDSSEGTITWKPSQSVVITFEGQSLPSHIYLFFNSLPVEIYTYPTTQCFNCCRFGHAKAACRSPPRCFKCGESHPADQCSSPSSPPKCFNCAGSHTAINSSCPEQSRQKNIKFSMASQNLSFLQASKLFPPVKKSFAEALSSNSTCNPPPSSTTSSSRSTKFTYKNPIVNPAPGYDQQHHNSLLINPNGSSLFSAPNGCAINSKPLSSSTSSTNSLNLFDKLSQDNSSFIQNLIVILIDLISSQPNLPSNAASIISNLKLLIQNGSTRCHNTSVE